MPTARAKNTEVEKKWHIVDAAGQIVGRLASQIAPLLRGKHRPSFVHNVDRGDFVIVTNAEKVKFTGAKLTDKFYYRYSGYVGGIKSISARDLLKKDPAEVIKQAVRGMMPKNKLSKQMLTKLKVYRGTNHPHSAQKPTPIKLREQN